MLLLLRVLFAGGLVTKVTMIGMMAALVYLTPMYVIKSVEVKHQATMIADQKVTIKQLSTDNEILKQNNATLKDSLDKVADANKSTADTNSKLIDERKQAQAAVDALARARNAERQRAADAEKKIQEMLKDPKNNGPVAPVLRETIRDIQNRRQ